MSAAVERVKSPYQEVRKRNYGYFSDECARSLLVCWLLSIYIYIYYIYKCIITIHIIIHILNVNGNSRVGLAKRGSI